MYLNDLVVFFGWCSVLNMLMLSLAALVLFLFRDPVMKIHVKLTGVDASALPQLYFSYLGSYKIAILILNIVPYVALKLMM